MLVKKIKIVLFLAVGLGITGHAVMTPVLMVLMLVTNDFLAMSLTTDRASTAPSPSKWRMREIMAAAIIFGLCKLDIFDRNTGARTIPAGTWSDRAANPDFRHPHIRKPGRALCRLGTAPHVAFQAECVGSSIFGSGYRHRPGGGSNGDAHASVTVDSRRRRSCCCRLLRIDPRSDQGAGSRGIQGRVKRLIAPDGCLTRSTRCGQFRWRCHRKNRCAKLVIDREIGSAPYGRCGYFMESSPMQCTDAEAYLRTGVFVREKLSG
jgi:hypothetical protein